MSLPFTRRETWYTKDWIEIIDEETIVVHSWFGFKAVEWRRTSQGESKYLVGGYHKIHYWMSEEDDLCEELKHWDDGCWSNFYISYFVDKYFREQTKKREWEAKKDKAYAEVWSR